MISRKVILTGSFGVGKTSLFNQFIYSKFDEKYLTTIGVKVNKKSIIIDDQEISILLWDIAGEISQDKVPVSYFLGASAMIYVFDVTRPSTQINLTNDINFLEKMLPDGIIKIVANKKDLVDEAQLATILASVSKPVDIATSAKTGENVEEFFTALARELM
jgi:small GTP-binding protein